MEFLEDNCIFCSKGGNVVKLEKIGSHLRCSNRACPYDPYLWKIAQETGTVTLLQELTGTETTLVNGKDNSINQKIVDHATASSSKAKDDRKSSAFSPCPLSVLKKRNLNKSKSSSSEEEVPADSHAVSPRASKDQSFCDGISTLYKNFAIWPSRDAFCWMNSALSLLVHSYNIRRFVHDTSQMGKCQMVKVFTDYERILTDANKNSVNPLDCVKIRKQLQMMQDYVFNFLEKDVRCVRGKSDLPVSAITPLLKENSALLDVFQIKHYWSLQCENCKSESTVDGLTNVPVVSFSKVMEDFNMLCPISLGTCTKCGSTDQKKKLNFEKLPQSFIFCFENGIHKSDLSSYDFVFRGEKYVVKGIILCTLASDQKHYVTWIRDVQTNSWLDCDDLKLGFHSLSPKSPQIVPSEVHIVMWENMSVLRKERQPKPSNLQDSVKADVSPSNKANTAKSIFIPVRRTQRMRHKSGMPPSKEEIILIIKPKSTDKESSSPDGASAVVNSAIEAHSAKSVDKMDVVNQHDATTPLKSEDQDSSLFPDVELPAFENSVFNFSSLENSKASAEKPKTTTTKDGKYPPIMEAVTVRLQDIFPNNKLSCNSTQISSSNSKEAESQSEKSSPVLSSEHVGPDDTKIESFVKPDQESTESVKQSQISSDTVVLKPAESSSEAVKDEPVQNLSSPKGTVILKLYPVSPSKRSAPVQKVLLPKPACSTTDATSPPAPSKATRAKVTTVTKPQRRTPRRTAFTRKKRSTLVKRASNHVEVDNETLEKASSSEVEASKTDPGLESPQTEPLSEPKRKDGSEKMALVKNTPCTDEIANPDPSVLQYDVDIETSIKFMSGKTPVKKTNLKNKRKGSAVADGDPSTVKKGKTCSDSETKQPVELATEPSQSDIISENSSVLVAEGTKAVDMPSSGSSGITKTIGALRQTTLSIDDLCKKLHKNQNEQLPQDVSKTTETSSLEQPEKLDTSLKDKATEPSTSTKKASVNSSQQKSLPKVVERRSTGKYNLRGTPKVSSMGKVTQQMDEIDQEWLTWTSGDEFEKDSSQNVVKEEVDAKMTRAKKYSMSLPEPESTTQNTASANTRKPGRRTRVLLSSAKRSAISPATVQNKNTPITKQGKSKNKRLTSLKQSSNSDEALLECLEKSKTVVTDKIRNAAARKQLSENEKSLKPSAKATEKSIAPKDAPMQLNAEGKSTTFSLQSNQVQLPFPLTSTNTVTINPQLFTCLAPNSIASALCTSSPNTLSKPPPLYVFQTIPTSNSSLQVVDGKQTTVSSTSTVQFLTSTDSTGQSSQKPLKSVILFQTLPNSSSNPVTVRLPQNSGSPVSLPGLTLDKFMISTPRVPGPIPIRPAPPPTSTAKTPASGVKNAPAVASKPTTALGNEINGNKFFIITDTKVPGSPAITLTPTAGQGDKKNAVSSQQNSSAQGPNQIGHAITTEAKPCESPQAETISDIENFISKMENKKETGGEIASSSSSAVAQKRKTNIELKITSAKQPKKSPPKIHSLAEDTNGSKESNGAKQKPGSINNGTNNLSTSSAFGKTVVTYSNAGNKKASPQDFLETKSTKLKISYSEIAPKSSKALSQIFKGGKK